MFTLHGHRGERRCICRVYGGRGTRIAVTAWVQEGRKTAVVARAIIVGPIVLLWGIRVLLRGGYDHVTGRAITIRERVKISAWGIVGGCERMEGM